MKTITKQKQLTLAQIIELFEATNRLEFIRLETLEPEQKFVFWDAYLEREESFSFNHSNNPEGPTLKKIMYYITNFFEISGFESGKEKAQHEIKKALGLF